MTNLEAAKAAVDELRSYVARHFPAGSMADRTVRCLDAIVACLPVAESATAERCETCGSDLYSGPPDCHGCGAPNCCQTCCKIGNLEVKLADALRAGCEVSRLKGELRERSWIPVAERPPTEEDGEVLFLRGNRTAFVGKVGTAIDAVRACDLDAAKDAHWMRIPPLPPNLAPASGAAETVLNANYFRCPETDSERIERLHLDVMCGFVSLGVCTPGEGFLKAPHCVGSCFDEVKQEIERLRAELVVAKNDVLLSRERDSRGRIGWRLAKEANEAAQRYIKILEAENAESPWTAVTERLPTEADGDWNGDVLWMITDKSLVTNTHQWHSEWSKKNYSHWMPIPLSPDFGTDAEKSVALSICCEPSLVESAEKMVAIVNNHEATRQERELAWSTLTEILFPSNTPEATGDDEEQREWLAVAKRARERAFAEEPWEPPSVRPAKRDRLMEAAKLAEIYMSYHNERSVMRPMATCVEVLEALRVAIASEAEGGERL